MPIGKSAKTSYFKSAVQSLAKNKNKGVGGRKIAAYLLDEPKKLVPLQLTGGGGDSSLGNKNRPSYYGPRR